MATRLSAQVCGPIDMVCVEVPQIIARLPDSKARFVEALAWRPGIDQPVSGWC